MFVLSSNDVNSSKPKTAKETKRIKTIIVHSTAPFKKVPLKNLTYIPRSNTAKDRNIPLRPKSKTEQNKSSTSALKYTFSLNKYEEKNKKTDVISKTADTILRLFPSNIELYRFSLTVPNLYRQ